MEMKVFCFLAILGAAYGLNIHPADRTKRDAELTAQVSASLNVSDHVQLLDLPVFGNAKEQLSKADFSKVTDLAKITVTDIALVPLGLRDLIEQARARAAAALGAAESDLETAVQQALLKAIHTAEAVKSISEVVYHILASYFDVAKNTIDGFAKDAIIEEGVSVSVHSVIIVQKSAVIVA